MNYEGKPWISLMNKCYSPEYEISGNILELVTSAKKRFEELTQCKYNLINYVIAVESLDNKYLSVSFIPNVGNFIDEIPFEIPVQGMYKNGQGYTLIYDLNTKELLDTIGMR